MPDIKELAVSYWRMDKWLKNVNVERKMAATSSLRAIKRFLDSNDVAIMDLTGEKFDAGLAVDVVNNDVPNGADESKVIISEMIRPVVIQNGEVIQLGQVSIGLSVKETLQNNTLDVESFKIIDAENKELKKKNKKYNQIQKVVLCGLIVIFCCLIASAYFAVSNNIKLNSTIAELNNTNNTITSIKNHQESQKSNISEEDGIRKFKEYIVKKGDTLEAICIKHGLDYIANIDIIKKTNSIYNENLIYIDQILLLPIE